MASALLPESNLPENVFEPRERVAGLGHRFEHVALAVAFNDHALTPISGLAGLPERSLEIGDVRFHHQTVRQIPRFGKGEAGSFLCSGGDVTFRRRSVWTG